MRKTCTLCGQTHDEYSTKHNPIVIACDQETALARKAAKERGERASVLKESDGSLENMFRLFRIEQPRGTVARFQEWFAMLKNHQESIKGCPWCHNQPALRVIPAFNKNSEPCLAYSVACEGDPCPVHPRLDLSFRTPEEAVKEWNDEH